MSVLVDDAAHCESPDTVDTLTRASTDRHYRVNAVAPASHQARWGAGQILQVAGGHAL